MLPSAEPERLGREEHVLADRRRLAEDVIAGLTLEDRQRQHPFGVEQSASEPMFGACRTKAVPVVDDVHAAAFRRITPQGRIDELRDQRDQRCTDIADRQKQRRARPVGVPEVVPAHRRHASGNREPALPQRPALGAVDVQELAAVRRGFNLAQPCRLDLVVEHVESVVIGPEQRGMAAGPRGRESAPAHARLRLRLRVMCRGRQIPECEPGESGAGAEQHRFLEFAQRHRRVRRLVAERPLRHFEAQAEAPGATAVQRLEQRIVPDLVERRGGGHLRSLLIRRLCAESIDLKLALYWFGQMVQFLPLEQTTWCR